MYDLIFIGGSPGVGKTTIAKLLQERLHSPRFELSWLRGYHLDRKWKNATNKEEQMSFENLIFIARNYCKYGYKNIVINDLQDFHLVNIPKIFNDFEYIIFTLFLTDEKKLKQRILAESRDSGFRDYEKAIKWNFDIQSREKINNEYRIDNTINSPEQTVNIILSYLIK